jgi:hypothetical protein
LLQGWIIIGGEFAIAFRPAWLVGPPHAFVCLVASCAQCLDPAAYSSVVIAVLLAFEMLIEWAIPFLSGVMETLSCGLEMGGPSRRGL